MSEYTQQPSDQGLIQRFRSNRDFTLREFGILILDMHLYSEPPILRSPMCSFPSLSPFWLHKGPCDRLSCDRYYTSRRGFGVYNDSVHTPPGVVICQFPTSSLLLTPVLHLLLGGPQPIPHIGKSPIAISRCLKFKVLRNTKTRTPKLRTGL
jgi:hypothetical protein